jgi:predicted transcriptional regulator
MLSMIAPKISEVFAAISDDSSLELFKLVALANSSTHDLRSKTKLTRKQYYSRLYRLTKYGLVRKRDKRYSLTTLGKILFDAETTIENTLENFWRIKAIDSIEVSDGITLEEHRSLVNTLINDQNIKSMLVK